MNLGISECGVANQITPEHRLIRRLDFQYKESVGDGGRVANWCPPEQFMASNDGTRLWQLASRERVPDIN
jgi:hypothetical protein